VTGNRVDFSPADGFMGRMNLPRTDALAGLLLRLWATLGLVLLAGCSTPTSAPPPEKGASLQVQPMDSAVAPASKEVACQIQLIDGALVASREGLKPGHHRLVVALGSNEGEFVGDVDLIIPAAKDYRLRAEREDDTFTLSLVETQTGKAVATSSAQAAALMTFQVFVLQK
jgi:hypothetical protein